MKVCRRPAPLPARALTCARRRRTCSRRHGAAHVATRNSPTAVVSLVTVAWDCLNMLWTHTYTHVYTHGLDSQGTINDSLHQVL